jgi:hypothetical protein
MKVFPPSSRNVEEAFSYVKNLPRRKGLSDYQAIREAGIGPLTIAPMFFVFMATSLDELKFLEIALGLGFGIFGIFSIVLGHRTLQLLELFPNSDLPMPTDERDRTADGLETRQPNKPRHSSPDRPESK